MVARIAADAFIENIQSLPIWYESEHGYVFPTRYERKAWLFSDTVHGAKSSANLYGLVETCKAKGHDPYHYLRHLFSELPKANSLPAWLAPVQVAVLSITDAQVEYANGVAQGLKIQGFLAVSDLRNEKIGLKIRELHCNAFPTC